MRSNTCHGLLFALVAALPASAPAAATGVHAEAPVAGASPGPANASSAQQYSLARCIRIGLESAQATTVSRLESDKAGHQLTEAIGRVLPQVSAFGTYDDYLQTPVQLVPGELFGQPGTSIPVSFYTKHNLQGGVRATQILFDMTAFVGVRLAKEASEWSAIKLDAARADTAHDIASLYLLIVAANAQAKVFQEDIERIERLHRIVQAQYAAGLVLGTDVARVAVERDNLVTEKANLDLLIARQHDMLAHTMGRFGSFATAGAPPMVLCDPLDRSLLSQPAADVRLPTIAEYATGPLHERAELRLREQQLEMADASEHLARAAFFPSLSAYSEWSYMGQRDRFDFFEHDGQKKWFEVQVVGLALSVPIFDGWQQMARVHQAEVDRRITATSSDFTRDSMTIEYAHAVEALRTSADAEARQAESVSAAAKTYDLTLKQYQQGVASLSDLLSVETSMSRARLGYLNSVHQLRIAELDILRATGKLLTLADREE